jgi:molybdopterin converting factor small subunit
VAEIKIPPILRTLTAGQKDVAVQGRTVRQMLMSLSLAHPGVAGHLFTDEGALQRTVNVYLNDEEVRELDGLDTASQQSDTLVLLPAMDGGVIEPAPMPWLVDLTPETNDPEGFDVRLQAISNALIRFLRDRPEFLHQLRPRQLEELMAELYAREGFEVELTSETRDQGVDLYLVRRTPFGALLTVVDTKRYRPDRPVGFGVVRQMFGVVEAKRASAGVIATTSFFSQPARKLQEEFPFRLGLQEFADIHAMLRAADGPKNE